MRLLSCSLVMVMFFVLGTAAAQEKTEPQPSAPQPQTETKKDKDQASKDKKKKEKSKQEDTLNTEVFSGAIANDVLSQLRDGLEGHSRRLMLSAFDGDKMDGYLSFEDQIDSLFNRYEAFRVHYRILQTTIEGARGIVLVDFQMEEIGRSANVAPVRKSAQLRFELERGRKGWRIVDFRPRNFFS